jgi:arylsulfatase
MPIFDLSAQATKSGTKTAGPTPPPKTSKPSIVIIWGDDFGSLTVSANNLGTMGYRSPNNHRLAREGALLPVWYSQNSCATVQTAFITRQSPKDPGLLKVGLPGVREGMTREDITIADIPGKNWLQTNPFSLVQHYKDAHIHPSAP